MDPEYSLQDLVRCHLCETSTPVPSLYCEFCLIHLCKACVGEHLSDESTEHKVVPIKKRGVLYPKCSKHPTRLCDTYCEQCDIPICFECGSSHQHLYHKQVGILNVLESKKKTIQRDLQELENSIYPKYKGIASNIPLPRVFPGLKITHTNPPAMDENRAAQNGMFVRIQNISEAVYAGMCLKIGTPQQVAFRREIEDITEILDNNVMFDKHSTVMLIGSEREGFRLNGSDVAHMHWPINHRVVWDFSQCQFYNTQEHALILCDNSESPPGFTLLWLPFEKANDIVMSACVRMNGCFYVSSSKYRKAMCSFIITGSTIHGPCSSGRRDNGFEYDHAYCFASDFWPPSAYSWIDRCHSWPPSNVVNDIISNGCHVVASGHKIGNHTDNPNRKNSLRDHINGLCVNHGFEMISV